MVNKPVISRPYFREDVREDVRLTSHDPWICWFDDWKKVPNISSGMVVSLVIYYTLRLHGMSWGVKTTCFKAV